ncbi:MAG: aminodeoxychorismate lyase [Saccharospirillum sp.]|uniref:aminodeoxychorismate lyase n=1 Tax=Saccharospirillum sp. TaxID=2033801 RepID=UPI0034A03207
MLACLLNSQPTDHLPLPSRMLAFGDGVFETCLVTGPGVRFVDDHLQRLQEGIVRLNLAWTDQDQQCLQADIDTLLKPLNSVAVLKIILGRQSAGRGYDYDPATQRTDRLLQLFEYHPAPWYKTGARLVTSGVPASINPALAGVKHLNRLDSVLARQSARERQAEEAILCDGDGWVVEGSMSNVFYRRHGRWFTPGLDRAGVNGIIRRRWLQVGDDALVVANIKPSDLTDCEAVLIGNTLMGLVPVTHLDEAPIARANEAELASLRTQIGLNVD